MKNTLIILPFLLLLIIGCDTKKVQDNGGNYTTVNFDDPFKMGMDKGVKMKDDDMKIEFVGIPEDSRCPEGVDCVWAGQVKVKLKLTTESGSSDIELIKEGKSSKQSSAKVGSVEVFLTDVSPYPKEGEEIKKEDYKLTLIVKKV